MRKERAHRYRSASELADDVQNYLNGAPLIAGPESMVYRLKKFARRNRTWVTGLLPEATFEIKFIYYLVFLQILSD